MNTSKMTGTIIAALLTGIALMPSCSKQSETQEAKKTGKSPVAVKANDVFSTAKSSLNVVRNGQYVTLGWQIDVTGGKIRKIDITRSSTGKITNRKAVATLEPGATGFKDCLPDENAYWYWVRFVTVDGKFQDMGPVRVEMDKAGSSHYIKLADIYKISITRTDDAATLKWDFPEESYVGIKITRAPRPAMAPSNRTGQKGQTGKATPVITTLERKSQYTDALANPNSDYWYWFQITLKSGAIVERGPIKAEYGNQ